MKSNKIRDHHLDTSVALDFLEQRLNAADRRQVEEHLGRPCTNCRERVRSLGEIIATFALVFTVLMTVAKAPGATPWAVGAVLAAGISSPPRGPSPTRR